MPTLPVFQTDQFNNENPARGDMADGISQTRVLAGILTSGTAQAGDRVKIDSTVTVPGMVGFVKAADNEAAFGVIKNTRKTTLFDSASEDTNKIEVAFQGGPVLYQCGAGTLTPGSDVALSSGFLVAPDGTHIKVGLLIDYVQLNTMGRVITGHVSV